MELTLRAAHKLVTKIEQHIPTVEVVTTVSANAFEVENGIDLYSKAQNDFQLNLVRVLQLQRVRQNLRDAIRRANEGEIDELISQRKSSLELIGLIKRIVMSARTEGVIATPAAVTRKAKQIVEGKGAEHRYGDERVTFTVVSPEQKEQFDIDLATYKRQLEAVEDQLLHKNISNKITLEELDLKVLRKERLV